MVVFLQGAAWWPIGELLRQKMNLAKRAYKKKITEGEPY